MNTTWNENTKRWVGIILPLVLALISALVVSRFAASADFHEKTITALDDKKATVLELTAASTAASAAITLGLHRKQALSQHFKQLESIWETYEVYLEEEGHGYVRS